MLPTLKDAIYRLSENEVECPYSYDFGIKIISKEEIEKTETMELLRLNMQGGLGMMTRNFYETREFIAFNFQNKNVSEIFVKSKKTGAMKICNEDKPYFTKSKMDIINKYCLKGAYGDYFVNTIEGVTLQSLAENARKNYPSFKTRWGHNVKFTSLRDIQPGSNPVVVLYRFRDF